MNKMISISLIVLFLVTISISGCINTNKTNSTWGEKEISIDDLKISNDTTGKHYEENDTIYYVNGNITNNNPFEALNVKIKIITYTSNGTVLAVNDTPYLNPKNVPGKGKSYFYARFEDPNKQITKFEVKILSANGQY